MLLNVLKTAAFCIALLSPAQAVLMPATRILPGDAANPPLADLHPLPAPRRAIAVPVPRWHVGPSDPSAQRRPAARDGYRMAYRATASGTASTTATGAIAVSNAAGDFLGYVTPSLNSYGEYGALTADKSQALIVTATSGGLRDLTQAQGIGGSPFIGAIIGYSTASDIGPDGAIWFFLGGTIQTARHSAAVLGDNSLKTATGYASKVESSVWNYDPATGALTVQWINSDLSQPATYLYRNSDFLMLTGSPVPKFSGDIAVTLKLVI